MKKRIKGREKKRVKRMINRPNIIFRNGTVSEFPEIRLVSGLEVKR